MTLQFFRSKARINEIVVHKSQKNYYQVFKIHRVNICFWLNAVKEITLDEEIYE